jgi:cytochrome c biogenesis protein CcdA
VAAHQGSDSALSMAVATLAGEATDRLQGIGEAIPLGFAFGLGMGAAVNPCGFALLPTYLALYLSTAAGERIPWPAQVRRVLQVSAAMTISFVAPSVRHQVATASAAKAGVSPEARPRLDRNPEPGGLEELAAV